MGMTKYCKGPQRTAKEHNKYCKRPQMTTMEQNNDQKRLSTIRKLPKTLHFSATFCCTLFTAMLKIQTMHWLQRTTTIKGLQRTA